MSSAIDVTLTELVIYTQNIRQSGQKDYVQFNYW